MLFTLFGHCNLKFTIALSYEKNLHEKLFIHCYKPLPDPFSDEDTMKEHSAFQVCEEL